MGLEVDSLLPSEKYVIGRKFAKSLKMQATNWAAKPAINRGEVLVYQNIVVDLVNGIDAHWTGANSNGVTDWARIQESRPALDLELEWADARAAIVALLTWVRDNYPADGSGNQICYGGFDASYKPVNIDLTAPQLSAYKTRITALVTALTFSG